MKLRQKVLDQMILNQVKILEENNKKLSYNPIDSEPPFSKVLCDHFIYMAKDTPIFATTKCQSLYPFIFKNESIKSHYENLIGRKFENIVRTSSLDSRQIMNLFETYQKVVAATLINNKTWEDFTAQSQTEMNQYFTKEYENLYEVQLKNVLTAAQTYDYINVSILKYFDNVHHILLFLESSEEKSRVLTILKNVVASDELVIKSFQPGFSSESEFSSNFKTTMLLYKENKAKVLKAKNIIEGLEDVPIQQIENHLNKFSMEQSNISDKILTSLEELIVILEKRSHFKII